MGFTLVEMMAVAAIVSAVPQAKYAQVKAKAIANLSLTLTNLPTALWVSL